MPPVPPAAGGAPAPPAAHDVGASEAAPRGRSAPSPRLGLAAAILLPLAAVLLACAPEPLREPPRELLGIWRTADPRYADRFLEIAPDAVVFGVGGGHSMVHRITGVRPLGPGPEGEGLRYRIEFRDGEGGTGALEVHHATDGDGPLLRLAHRDAVWRPSRHRIDP